MGYKFGRRRGGLGKGSHQDTDQGGPQVFYVDDPKVPTGLGIGHYSSTIDK